MGWFRKSAPPGPPLTEKLRENISSIAQLEQEFAARRSELDRLSDAITTFVGSVQFILAHMIFFALWVMLNTSWVLGEYSFDPYPYVFLNFVLAAEAVFLGTFVLMSQNRQNRQAEERAHLDLQISMLA